jgi:Ca-activated chloride channel family protein
MMSRPRALAVGLLAWLLAAAVPYGQTPAPQTQAAGVVIDGSVVDAALNPLPGVTLTLLKADKTVATTASDAKGEFHFARVAPGAYKVRAELTNFAPITRDLTLKTSSSSITLPLVLDVQPGLTKDEIAQLPAATRQSLNFVTFLPGVNGATSANAATGAAVPAPPPPAGIAGSAGGRGGGGGARSSTVAGLPQSSLNIPIDAVPQATRQSPSTDGFYPIYSPRWPYPPQGESYLHLPPNRFHTAFEDPVSTFGADVDTASFSNIRRFLSAGQLPPADAVRVEELVNYFHFNYAEPRGPKPIALTTEVGDCPWAPAHKLVLVGARAKSVSTREVEGRNLVLLIDVSGSMADKDKLPLIKTALNMFVDTLEPADRLAIVTYAGESGIALPSTEARNRAHIHDVIDQMQAGGSTNGGSGLIMAYRTALQSFIPGGVNRVILATDGDFNVGIVNQHELIDLIQRERGTGVFLSVFGVGTGNLKDSTMEMLADRGNGTYAYLDSLQEARRVLIREANATFETVAKDVKFQVEFNPATVTAWKLLGYEDRALAPQDFNNDRKDAGEVGAGHSVTALYEIVPTGASVGDSSDRPVVDPLKYQPSPEPAPRPAIAVNVPAQYAGELLTVKVRYKQPDGDVSDLIQQSVKPGGRVQNLPFAAAVAEFGLLLRDPASSLVRWERLSQRLKTLDAPADAAADRQAFSDLVDLAVGLRKLAGQ